MKTPHPAKTLAALIILAPASRAGAAVTFYDGRPGASAVLPPGFVIQHDSLFDNRVIRIQDNVYAVASHFDLSTFELIYFTQGADLEINGSAEFAEFVLGGSLAQGAVETTGDFTTGYTGINFALLDFDNDGYNETVGAFAFSTEGGMLIATTNLDAGFTNHSISAGYAELQAASGGSAGLQGVPEPSSLLLAGLSAVALLRRRRGESHASPPR